VKTASKYLQGTRVHLINLSWNQISDQGAIALAKHLHGTEVHTVYLWWNHIGPNVERLLKEKY
jgi:hypothetical protein